MQKGMKINLEKALKHPLFINHKKTDLYQMDGRTDKWKLVYYPIFQDGKTNEFYHEPRALMQNIDKEGFWSKEVPLRYIKKINQN